jgi:very-short-patch-repair endonuclease
VNRARLLRKKASDPERRLWRHLPNRNFAGYKFRRQHPLDCYILDFYRPAAKLAIELEGGGIIIVSDKFGIERARHSLTRKKESLYFDFGIIRFPGNSTASCKRSGLRCNSGARPIPHLNPLCQRERRIVASS